MDRKVKTAKKGAAKAIAPRATTGADLIADMRKLIEVIRSGEPIEKHFTVRQMTVKVEPRQYTADDVKAVREKLHASQALFAKFLGVTTQTVSLWEQGRRKPALIACRYMDDIQEFPEIWKKRLTSVKLG